MQPLPQGNTYPYQLVPTYFSIEAKDTEQLQANLEAFFRNMRGYLKECHLLGISADCVVSLSVNQISVCHHLRVRGFFPLGESMRLRHDDDYDVQLTSMDGKCAVLYFSTKNKFNID